jgi:hypothetical protein
MAITIDPHTHLKLVSALTEFDRKESRKKYHNPYALSHYLTALRESESEVEAGGSLARALYDHFNGRLLTAMERSVGLIPTYGGGAKSTGRPA